MRFLRIGKLIAFVVVPVWLFVLATPPPEVYQKKNADVFVIDTAKSKINWKCGHYGYLKLNSGEIVFNENKELATVNFSVNMTSITNIDIESELLQKTLGNVLKSVEFFNTNIFPEARFESDTISKIKNTNSYKFTGDYIIFEKGICSVFEGNIEIKKDTLHLKVKDIIIDRTDWGIFYLSANNKTPKDEEEGLVVSDTITINAHIQAYKKNK